jgi:carboxypeptidase C (cathepsin A)
MKCYGKQAPVRKARYNPHVAIPLTRQQRLVDRERVAGAQDDRSLDNVLEFAEVKGSHAVYVSQPKAVAAIIAKAANGVALAAR